VSHAVELPSLSGDLLRQVYAIPSRDFDDRAASKNPNGW
jgi:hypothetical protein